MRTVVVNDEYRRAIRRYYGESGLATRKEVRRWLEQHGTSVDDDLLAECGDDQRAALKGD